MLFVGFCGRFLRQTLDLSKHDPNEYAVDPRRSLGANHVRRDLPSLVAREPARNQHRSPPRAFCGTLATPADSSNWDHYHLWTLPNGPGLRPIGRVTSPKPRSIGRGFRRIAA
jgi:hypothetical protein